MRKIVLLGMLMLVFCFLSGFKTLKSQDGNKKVGPDLVPDEIVVTYVKGFASAARTNMKKRFGLGASKKSFRSGEFEVFKHKDPASVIEQLKKEPGVLSVEQNAYAHATMIPNDTYYPYQWNMERIGMEDAWDVTSGSGVVVAVLDTGVRQSLPDFNQTNFTAGYDFVNNDNDPDDDQYHGSHVAGTIAQSTNNGRGVAGVAYSATIMPVKVLDANGDGSYTDIADGINFAVNNGADVINMSLVGYSNLTVLRNAVQNAWNNGVVVVCAAGNDDTNTLGYPASYTQAISVSAIGGNDALASYSNYGSAIDITAPGGDTGDYNNDGYDDLILQNMPYNGGNGYYFLSGTSMACPHVAGVAALVWSVDPSLTNTEVRNILETTAEDLGSSGWDQYFGEGLVDAKAAVDAAGGGSQCLPNWSTCTQNSDCCSNNCSGWWVKRCRP